MKSIFNKKSLKYLLSKFPDGDHISFEQTDNYEFTWDTLIFTSKDNKRIVIDVTPDNAIVSFEKCLHTNNAANKENNLKNEYGVQESEYIIDLLTGEYETSFINDPFNKNIYVNLFPENLEVIQGIRYFGNNALDFIMDS